MLPAAEHEEIFYRIALALVPDVGTKRGRVLLERYGSAANIFKAPLKELKKDGVGEARAKGFKDEEMLRKAEQELEYVIKHDIQCLYPGSNYPERLNNCADAPLLLFYKGNADLNAKRMVAIVGTRKNTDYGHQLCEELVDGLKGMEDTLIVSGMALGIDAIAHKKCVQMGMPTVGVFGHGLDRVYPYSHKGLSEQMVRNGGLLTEFFSGTQPDRSNFPMRNRIVAGICDVTVVVESNIAGGALITARTANSYNREVAAFPGRVNDTRSAGCNELIRTNVAAMITKADDLVDMMMWREGEKLRPIQKQLFLNLLPEEQKIIDLLQTKERVHADEILYGTGIAGSLLAATLLALEMQGLIKTLPGKHYRMS